jgi:NDP-sugar pyrophosphorylase family protein
MALLPKPIPGDRPVYHQNGFVKSFGQRGEAPIASKGEASAYASVQVLSNAFLQSMPKEGVFEIVPYWEAALAAGHKVGAFPHAGFWHDLRNPAMYWDAVKAYLALPYKTEQIGVRSCRARRGFRTIEREGGVLSEQFSRIAPTAKLGPNVIIESGCEVGDEAVIRNAVLLPGTKVAPRAVVENAIVGEKIKVPLTAPQ